LDRYGSPRILGKTSCFLYNGIVVWGSAFLGVALLGG
jgi:hypothetical protein